MAAAPTGQFVDQAAGVDGVRDHAGSVRQAFVAVGVEQPIVGHPVGDHPQLPGQVRSVTHTRAQPLSEERRHLVSGIAGKKHPTHPHGVGHRGVESIHHGAHEIGVVGRQPWLEQLPHPFVGRHVGARLPGLQLELPAAVVVVADDIGGRPGGVADLLHERRQRRHWTLQPDVEHQPVLVEPLVDERQPELFADRARCAVRGDQPGGGVVTIVGVRDDPVVCLTHGGDLHAEPEVYSCAHGGGSQELFQLRLVVGDRGRMAQRILDVAGHLDADDPLAVDGDELGPCEGRGDRPQLVGQPGVLEHPLDLVVHHDRSGQVVHLGGAFEHPHHESTPGEQQSHGDANRSAADDEHVDSMGRHVDPPRKRPTSASAWASMNCASSVSWPSRRASGALT